MSALFTRLGAEQLALVGPLLVRLEQDGATIQEIVLWGSHRGLRSAEAVALVDRLIAAGTATPHTVGDVTRYYPADHTPIVPEARAPERAVPVALPAPAPRKQAAPTKPRRARPPLAIAPRRCAPPPPPPRLAPAAAPVAATSGEPRWLAKLRAFLAGAPHRSDEIRAWVRRWGLPYWAALVAVERMERAGDMEITGRGHAKTFQLRDAVAAEQRSA